MIAFENIYGGIKFTLSLTKFKQTPAHQCYQTTIQILILIKILIVIILILIILVILFVDLNLVKKKL